jgi:hypothetical protein
MTSSDIISFGRAKLFQHVLASALLANYISIYPGGCYHTETGSPCRAGCVGRSRGVAFELTEQLSTKSSAETAMA